MTHASRLHAVIRGRVQGVGFRDATWREGRRLGLRGWVRNRLDGTVEVLAEGPRNALEELETLLRRGPRMAAVTGADIFWEVSPTGADDPSSNDAQTETETTHGSTVATDRLEAFAIR